MIVYREIKNSNQEIIQVSVYHGSRRVGAIHKETCGWQYLPTGHSSGGEILESIAAVKRSLESDD